MKIKRGALPNLIVIGAQKCGTTSLHYYLGCHPQIHMSQEKELDFFVQEKNWKRGMDWYMNRFRRCGLVRGESSPNYTNYPLWRGVPKRMASHLQKPKLVYILRDPIIRVISHYIQDYALRRVSEPLSECLKQMGDDDRYIRRSKYHMQLTQYLECFDLSDILVITLEDLKGTRQKTMQKVFRFLRVDDTFRSPRFHQINHQSKHKRRLNRIGLSLKRAFEKELLKKLFSPSLRWHLGRVLTFPFSRKIPFPELDEALRAELTLRLGDDIDRLREKLGRPLRRWSV